MHFDRSPYTLHHIQTEFADFLAFSGYDMLQDANSVWVEHVNERGNSS